MRQIERLSILFMAVTVLILLLKLFEQQKPKNEPSNDAGRFGSLDEIEARRERFKKEIESDDRHRRLVKK